MKWVLLTFAVCAAAGPILGWLLADVLPAAAALARRLGREK